MLLAPPPTPPAGTRPRLTVRECDQREAMAAVRNLHRHLPKPPPGALVCFRVSCERGIGRGWALVGRPCSRHLQAAGWVEVTRCATDGTRNACSALYGAAARWAKRRGSPILTYTLPSESGGSLRGAGWVQRGQTQAQLWDRPGRRRDSGIKIRKLRWAPSWCAERLK